MPTTLRALAEIVRGDILGDADQNIQNARALHEAEAGDITLVDHERHIATAAACPASAVVVPRGIAVPGKSLIRVDDPLAAFVAVFTRLHGLPEDSVFGIDPRADVHPTCLVGAGASVHPYAVIGQESVVGRNCRIMAGAVVGQRCRIGNDVTLHPRVVLYDGVTIGDRVTIHSGAVIGADGFGYRFQSGKHVKVPQLGTVVIEDDVEIGAGTTIDRGTFGATRIGAGTKIDNLVMIAHNCRIGKHNILVSQMGMAGSSSTGDYVVVAGQVGIVDHVHIGDRSVVGGQAAITKDVPPDSRMLGSPATPEKEQKRILMSLLRLPEFRKELREVQEKLGMVG